MKKTISILITMMLVFVTIASIGGSEKLEGTIEVDVKGWAGNLYPTFNLTTNQSLTINVDVETVGNDTIYHVNDTITIDLKITDDTGREIVLIPRFMSMVVFVHRDMNSCLSELSKGILKSKAYPGADNIFKRCIPTCVIIPFIGAVPGAFLNNIIPIYDHVNITLDYHIDNTTFENGENLTMGTWVASMMVPADVNGGSNGVSDILPSPIGKKIMKLEIDYQETP